MVRAFRLPAGSGCSCMRDECTYGPAWDHAAYMPALDSATLALVAVPFDPSRFQRLARLPAELRQLDW